jgi:two-component system, NtrC family, sensor kinase
MVAERTEAIAMSAHNYQKIFEISMDIIMVCLKDGTILDINPAGLKMLGFDPSESIPARENFQSFFENLRDWDHLNAEIEQHGFTPNEEFTLKCRDGSIRRMMISSVINKGEGPTTDAIHFFIKDIEQVKRMEQKTAQAEKLASLGHFSFGIAHEINNPLGIIMGYTQLLLRGENPESEKYQDLKTIEKHVQICKSIVEDLLNFARSSKPSRDVVRLNHLVEDAVLCILQHSKLEDGKIARNYDHNLPPVILDEKKIQQAVMNLIMNAADAIEEKGTIAVSTRYGAGDHQVTLEVKDTGCGIEQKNLPCIFDPFFTTKPTGEGKGLGLSVSYGIIKNHGGDIFVESNPGKGTTVTVVLPVNK